MPKVRYNLKKGSASDALHIRLIFRYDKKVLTYYTGEKILLKDWNTVENFPRKTQRATADLLKSLTAIVTNIFTECRLQRHSPTTGDFKEMINERLGKSTGAQTDDKDLFFVYARNYIERQKRVNDDATMKKYTTTVNHLEKFCKQSNVKNLKFDEIDKPLFEDFKNYLVTRPLAPVTVAKCVSQLSTILSNAEADGISENAAYLKKWFSASRGEELEKTYLTDKDLSNIRNAPNLPPYLDRARDFLLIGCYTGLRYSDYSQVNNTNVHDENGRKILKLILSKGREKKPQKVAIPLHDYVIDILEKYDGQPPKVPQNQPLNRAIKELCKRAKLIYEVKCERYEGTTLIEETNQKFTQIGTHTGRRTFITLALIKGLSVEEIRQMTGHKDFASFKKYARQQTEQNAARIANHSFFTKGSPLTVVSKVV